jgi:predicted RNase H-like HicB family nuclease
MSPSPMIIEQYITAAVAGALPREREDGCTGCWGAELTGFPGVCATARTREQCLAELADVLRGWLEVKLAHRDPDIPVVDGINLSEALKG